MSYSALLSPITVGAMRLPNRVFMAPLTRLRSADLADGTSENIKGIGGMPTPLMAEYYTQRASSGMIIAEATDISPEAKGYAGAPGMFNAAQIAGWKMIADSVHQAGGHMGVQLWHTGVVSHYRLRPHSQPPVSASSVDLGDAVRTSLKDDKGNVYRVTATPAREMTTAEIKETVDDFAKAARNAMQAGMGFVEIHAAHGYLIHQFLYDSVNQRSDEYGGSLENRMRFLKEILTAVTNAIGSERVGIRISPLGVFNGVAAGSEDDALAIIQMIDGFNLAYLHISEPDWAGGKPLTAEFRRQIRDNYHGVIIGAGAYTAEKADKLIREGLIDAAAFGRSYIANPDLVERFSQNAPLNSPNSATFYGGDKEGYTDYPSLAQ